MNTAPDRLAELRNRNVDKTLPNTTLDTSEEYLELTALVVSHAMLPNPVWGILFESSDEARLQSYNSMLRKHFNIAITAGAFVIEAGDFSACAMWHPPGSHEPPKIDDIEISDTSHQRQHQEDTAFTAFTHMTEKIYADYIWSKYGQEFWSLKILGRDPRKPAIKGAVRAVLQPVMDLASVERKPIWLVTTNKHARDIYLHYGWQVVGTVTLHTFSSWCMVLYPHSRN